jgi:hypothetical protein
MTSAIFFDFKLAHARASSIILVWRFGIILGWTMGVVIVPVDEGQ